MAECHPVGLPVGDGGQGARRQAHPRRPPVHAHAARWPTCTCRCVPAPTSPSSAASSTTSSTNGLDFREYVVNYTNATDDPARGLRRHRGPRRVVLRFRRRRTRRTTTRTWQYEGMDVQSAAGHRDAEWQRQVSQGSAVRESGRGQQHGAAGPALQGTPERDDSMQHPRCVFQVLKRHFARYTPEMVERDLRRAAGAVRRGVPSCSTEQLGTRTHRARSPMRSAGRSTPSGVQYIRTAAILQLLLGNIGRPGGGILALRGHAIDPGLDRHPDAVQHPSRLHPDAACRTASRTSSASPRPSRRQKGYWANMHGYLVSLLKAWWGEAATADNDFCFDYLPRLTGESQHLRDASRRCSKARCTRLLPARREPGGRFGELGDAAPGDGRTSIGLSYATSR